MCRRNLYKRFNMKRHIAYEYIIKFATTERVVIYNAKDSLVYVPLTAPMPIRLFSMFTVTDI